MARDDGRHRDLAVDVARRLQEAGHRALWAGGCVRDILLGRAPSDYDVATDATPERVMALFRRTIPVGVSFGVVRVLGPPGAGAVEVATFRSDGSYLDGRRPESVSFGTVEDDARRRDFTVNGMYLDPVAGDVLDLVGGRSDLSAGVIRAIGSPSDRFAEDKLRLLRAVRFAARLGFEIEPDTGSALSSMAPEIRVVAPERVADEFRKMLSDPGRARALSLSMDHGLIAAIHPEVAARPGDRSVPTTDRDDPWAVTLRVVAALPASASFTLAFAGYARISADRRQADAAATRLKLSNEERGRIGWLWENRSALVDARALPGSILKPILASRGAPELIELHRAIASATGGDFDHVDYCDRYRREEPDGPLDPPPLVDGGDLAGLGYEPGPIFRRILGEVRERQLDRIVDTREDALAWVVERFGRP